MQTSKTTYRRELPAAYALQGYRIRHVLGQGAFGITYCAHDVNLNRLVAIKEYLPMWIATRADRQTVIPESDDVADEFTYGLTSFITEARTLAKFVHPNIVQVHNVFEANGTAYMVMQNEEGDTLTNILRKQLTLTEREILQFIFPLLAGLEEVHEAGFIHRDIKPGNIFIRQDGSPVLIDFGSARQVLQSQSRELTNLVTKGYAPIEQYTGKSEAQGPWTDIYSLAATLYRAVIGQPPNDAVERGESLANDATDTFRSVTERAAGRYQEKFLQAIDGALNFRREERPQTVAEWRMELATASTPEIRHYASADNDSKNVRDTSHKEPAHDLVAIEPLVSERTTRVVDVGALAIPSLVRHVRLWSNRRAISSAAVVMIVTAIASSLAGSDKSQLSVPASPSEPSPSPIVQVGDAASTEQLMSDDVVAPSSSTTDSLVIEDLLASASDDVAALRLTTPDRDNAYDKYQRVLLIDPDNEMALDGINTIADQYIELTYRHIDRGNFERAEHYVQKALQFSSNIKAAADALQTLGAKRSVATQATQATLATLAVKEPVIENGVEEQDSHRGNAFLRRIGGASNY